MHTLKTDPPPHTKNTKKHNKNQQQTNKQQRNKQSTPCFVTKLKHVKYSHGRNDASLMRSENWSLDPLNISLKQEVVVLSFFGLCATYVVTLIITRAFVFV